MVDEGALKRLTEVAASATGALGMCSAFAIAAAKSMSTYCQIRSKPQGGISPA